MARNISFLIKKISQSYGLKAHSAIFLNGRHPILPKEINALSLRRTFGRLLLRSEKSTKEVAAAMGNTSVKLWGKLIIKQLILDKL